MAARTLFVTNYNLAVPASTANIEASAAAISAVDGTRNQDTTLSFVAVIGGNDTTVAAAILGCSPIDTGATVATPGIAKVTAIVAVDDGQDIVRTVDVTVIGPPHTLTVAAAPSARYAVARRRRSRRPSRTRSARTSLSTRDSKPSRNAGGVLAARAPSPASPVRLSRLRARLLRPSTVSRPSTC